MDVDAETLADISTHSVTERYYLSSRGTTEIHQYQSLTVMNAGTP